MKDMSSLVWIAGIGFLAYYGYQQGWFGNLTVGTPSVIPPVTAPIMPVTQNTATNIVPTGVLTPIESTPVIPTPVVNPPAVSSSPQFAIMTGDGCVGCM